MGEIAQQLMATSLGQELSAGEATELASAAVCRSVGRDSFLFRNGDSGNGLYVVLTGSFHVVLGQAGRGGPTVATVGPGQIVGELEAMTRSLRAASLLAVEESTVLELPTSTFDQMLTDGRGVATKLLRNIARTLARRLAAVNQRIMEKTPPPPPEELQAVAAPAEEVEEADISPIGDDDLDVLDKLWS